MRLGRRQKVNAGFLVVWMVVWTAAMIVAVWYLGGSVLRGELGAGIFLAIWLTGAGFGLYSAVRNLLAIIVTGAPRKPDNRRWDDGIDPPP
jgi:hypothetical protein